MGGSGRPTALPFPGCMVATLGSMRVFEGATLVPGRLRATVARCRSWRQPRHSNGAARVGRRTVVTLPGTVSQGCVNLVRRMGQWLFEFVCALSSRAGEANHGGRLRIGRLRVSELLPAASTCRCSRTTRRSGIGSRPRVQRASRCSSSLSQFPRTTRRAAAKKSRMSESSTSSPSCV